MGEKNPKPVMFQPFDTAQTPFVKYKTNDFSWDLLVGTTSATATESRFVYACTNGLHTNSSSAPQLFFLH